MQQAQADQQATGVYSVGPGSGGAAAEFRPKKQLLEQRCDDEAESRLKQKALAPAPVPLRPPEPRDPSG